MIGVSAFVKKVEQIALRDLTYRTGGVGKDGTCDCIGLIMGAMYELGHKAYDLHSANYFSRYQTLELKKAREKDLFIGQILYRARTNQDELNGRYMPGGRYYTGDLLDYYHVAVVTSINPLQIIECTEYKNGSGIVRNSTFKGWDYGGKLRGVLYDETDAGGIYEEKEEEAMTLYQATVITQKDPLVLRATPNGREIGRIPKGETVDVIAEGEWARVRWGDAPGYVASRYLGRIEKDYAELTVRVILTDSEGNTWEPVGAYTARVQLEADGEAID